MTLGQGLPRIALLNVDIFHCATQQFGGAPGLGDAAARRMRRVAVGNFRELSQTGRAQMAAELLQPAGGLGAGRLTAPVH